MSLFAVVNKSTNIVENTIVCDNLETAQQITDSESVTFVCIEYSMDKAACIGDTYDGKNFITPLIEASPKP
jgi:hypothetical protein